MASTILRDYQEDLPVPLNDEEKIDRGHKLAAAHEDIAAEEERQDAMKKQMKSRMVELEARRSQLATIVSRGSELRPVRVQDLAEHDAGRMTRVRMDTGLVLYERALSDEARQTRMVGVL